MKKLVFLLSLLVATGLLAEEWADLPNQGSWAAGRTHLNTQLNGWASNLVLSAVSSETVTNNGAITVNTNYTMFTTVITEAAAIASTNTLPNPGRSRAFLTIINGGTNVISIADANNAKVSSTQVDIGPWDSVSFVASSATQWVQTATSNN